MKILATIAHFFNREGDGYYGSTGANTDLRAAALGRAVAALHQVFGASQAKLLNRIRRIMTPANRAETYDVDVAICTAGERHLLGALPIPAEMYRRVETDSDPMLLGFACHEVLKAGLGEYDFYCYLEDDLVVQDPLFLVKLKWFNTHAGDEALLQPNRFELSVSEPVAKLYIDGHISVDFTSEWQDITDRPTIDARVMGTEVAFERTPNPHSGCFFLNARQMETWAGRPYFLDRDVSFAGALESAATLGLMKTFRVYKPAPANAGFLEILHANNRYLGNWLKL